MVANANDAFAMREAHDFRDGIDIQWGDDSSPLALVALRRVELGQIAANRTRQMAICRG